MLKKPRQLEPSWSLILQYEFEKEYFIKLEETLEKKQRSGVIIYPPTSLRFNALNLTPFNQVKVVIIGQDPYHGFGQAHGLSFSVPNNIATPPSLRNIFKELNDDIPQKIVNLSSLHGNLTGWAKQGVLLLNAVLTVEHNKVHSHALLGWEIFTNKIIETLNKQRSPLVFILWGSYAQKKIQLINDQKHFIIKSPHPSPLSSYRGFFGSKPFSKCNLFLEKNKIDAIDWYKLN